MFNNSILNIWKVQILEIYLIETNIQFNFFFLQLIIQIYQNIIESF